MKWIIKDKPVNKKPRPKKGGLKLVRKFLILPKSYYNSELCQTEWYWLQKVYICYKYYEADWFPCPWGAEQYEPAHWERIGITEYYSKAIQRGWTN